ncbi:FAD binding domain-containing protein [Anaerotignum lactatifermentans]|uniref:FAD binding domain-containing protein n=1 Tax=Anaerotignum lactatifermentans TaxID=160404 RepID=A0ABS2G9D1_9FIRM|nr:FAD binding domain-containing protein [Anaerotignum lactatifermentans]MBM6829432.1 FAD binding domain-containing protein [Anaerotignum lactatifermentans]MBM6877790.1 FAD binding domain-containing protein [Anaerotignum lactatifermentans]MBM6951009.1 FAD binding domain-containing protein [Anaerotignum lactatifermentans]
MYSIRTYVKVSSLEEAYELNQKKMNTILGGGLWLRLGKKNIQTAIDLSGLGLDQITEDETAFFISAMVSLRQLEIHPGIDTYTGGAVKESLRHIVGVQMRNCATVGGSIYGRFGFSDPLCCLLGLDCEVELYQAGRIPLAEFVKMKKDNDILVQVILKKTDRKAVYLSQRNSATDFPVVSCALSKGAAGNYAVIGARPCMPVIVEDREGLLERGEEGWKTFAEKVQQEVAFADNTRASGAYRRHVAGVLVRRGAKALWGGAEECR